MVEHSDTTTTPHPPLKCRNSIPSAVLLPHRKHKTISNGNGNHHYHHHHNHRSPPSTSPSSFSGTDFELVSLKSAVSDSYTSLKDILPSSPSSILSPTPASALAGISTSSGSGYEISIRNRLVKQAAWAYLQPAVSSSPSSSSRGLCFLFSGDSLRTIFAEFRRVVAESAARFHDWLVDALWLILCR